MTIVSKGLLILLAGTTTVSADHLTPVVPSRKTERILVDSQRLADAGEQAYLAFPTLVRLESPNILISYKRGRSHAADPGAMLEVARFNSQTEEVVSRQVLARDEKLIYQLGEWLEFPSGRIGLFADVQHMVHDVDRDRYHRAGVQWCKTDDRGATFGPMKPLGPVDGTEYGYVFEGVVSQGRTYMLAMAFPELTERRSVLNEAGKRIFGEVSALASDDDGESWRHVRNLSREFGRVDINESSLIEYGDGFIVATRGYDRKARLHLVDRQFRLLCQRDLTDDYEAMTSFIGRPRLFFRGGRLYLLGRNHSNNRSPMELALFRVCTESLGVERYVILDPEEGIRVGDSYYGVPYFQGEGDDALFHVVTYRLQPPRRHPDIVLLTYPWSEVRSR